MRYRILRGRVEVRARSGAHDLVTVWSKPSGTIEFDPDEPRAARAELTLDMAAFDAGDALKNWKLRGDLAPDAHPVATFTLTRFEDVHEPLAGRFEGTLVGQLAWRGRRVEVRARGRASVDRRALDATGTFELDVRQVGVSPPHLFVFKVDEVVRVQLALFALPA